MLMTALITVIFSSEGVFHICGEVLTGYPKQCWSKISLSGSHRSNPISTFLMLLFAVDLHAKVSVKSINEKHRSAPREYSWYQTKKGLKKKKRKYSEKLVMGYTNSLPKSELQITSLRNWFYGYWHISTRGQN